MVRMFVSSIIALRGGLSVLAAIASIGWAVAQAGADVKLFTEGQTTLLVEARSFQFRGDWLLLMEPGAPGRPILRSSGAGGDAATVVHVPTAGEYAMWTHSRDYPNDQPGTRRFLFLVDDIAASRESGQSGKFHFTWERVGTVKLAAGEHCLRIRDTARFFARCDAVMLTTSQADPETLSAQEQLTLVTKPLAVAARPAVAIDRAPSVTSGEARQVAMIENESTRIRFLESRDVAGMPRITRQTEVRRGDGAWMQLAINPSGESLYLYYAPAAKAIVSGYYPTWTSSIDALRFEAGGKEHQIVGTRQNPFLAAQPVALAARSAAVADGGTVDVTFAPVSGEGVPVVLRWQLESNRPEAKVTATFTAERAGDYSLAFSAFAPVDKDKVEFNLLPPLYQYQRLPEAPVMLTSAVTPVPAAMVQSQAAADKSSVVMAVIADPDGLPFRWPTANDAPYGFSLQNAHGEVQPSIFAPVLGMNGAAMKAGETKTVSWYVLAVPGDWRIALERIVSGTFGVRDYRRPIHASLSDAALNMLDLLRDDNYSGWSDKLKGFYNIEHQGAVVQASPLEVVSAAVLADDEELWVRRALPTIEYTLTRSSPHFLRSIGPGGTMPEVRTHLAVSSLAYGTSYWLGLQALLGRTNPWMNEFAFSGKQAKVLNSKGFHATPFWAQELAAYRFSPTPERLKAVVDRADQWLKTDLYGRKTNDLGIQPFYNISYYPCWWDLLDLYDVTHDRKYIEAAEYGAMNTIAGLWCYPRTPAGEVTVHPGGRFVGIDTIWWKDNDKFRLGYPRRPGDTPERTAPAWLVSPIGLGFEQPVTYHMGNDGLKMIYMSSWTPSLMRLYALTGKDIYRAAARNGIIGRFSNYPGYYVRGFTDLPQGPRFPYEGPDLTNIYYHHIPPHLAFTVDFLISEAEARSNGAIRFPYVRQEGYAWFSNRIYGHAPGAVFDQSDVQLRMDRQLVRADSKDINVIVGRAPSQLCIVLMSESDEAVTTTLTIDIAKTGVRVGEQGALYDAAGKRASAGMSASAMSVRVPPKGLVVLNLPAAAVAARKVPPLENGHLVCEPGKGWPAMHAFRIRSPFGKDALYVALTGKPEAGLVATLTPSRGAPITAGSHPYEFTLYPLPMDQDAGFSLELRMGDKRVVLDNLMIPGTH